ncbi:unnamed protein product [Owenia fusiformis]|uniref:Uncharacterized protein n=1 Tax=Owenia fusiformis TaxID=6347 RepID=A0A8J1UEU6_OWEFU|nr:unnamed protein product [Owenia fusiformis]
MARQMEARLHNLELKLKQQQSFSEELQNQNHLMFLEQNELKQQNSKLRVKVGTYKRRTIPPPPFMSRTTHESDSDTNSEGEVDPIEHTPVSQGRWVHPNFSIRSVHNEKSPSPEPAKPVGTILKKAAFKPKRLNVYEGN